MNDQELKEMQQRGSLLYNWMPVVRPKAYGSGYLRKHKPRKQILDTCKRCNCDITDLSKIRGRKLKYCPSCKILVNKEHARNRDRKHKIPVIPRSCKECLEIFTPKYHNTEFCGNKCSSANYRKKNRKTKVCPECHNEVALLKHKYCGSICMNISRYRRAIRRLEALRK